ncbi:MAG: hypothetical protein U1C55_09950 [Smithellaceae bacterium]|nr:hypothetical protein [Smithellaceae bacterium]
MTIKKQAGPARKVYLFDKPGNVKRLLWSLYASLALLVVIDLFIPKHPYFSWEGYPSFYAAYGFISFALLVLAAKHILRRIVKRKEDYYDR